MTLLNQDFIEVSEKSYNFSGFEVTRDTGKISYIKEYLDGSEIGKISFRPTSEPLIFSVVYQDGYIEQRYNNGGVSCVYNYVGGHLQGEYRRYDIAGDLQARTFYHESTDITPDIMSFIGFSGSNEEFTKYEFSTDELFNISMRYGSFFKFNHELKRSSARFDEIVRNCLA